MINFMFSVLVLSPLCLLFSLFLSLPSNVSAQLSLSYPPLTFSLFRNVLFEILGWGMKPQNTSIAVREKLMRLLVGGASGSQIQPNSFEELYCTAFVLFDTEWTDMRATYMDFPKVLEASRKKFEAFLVQSNSVEDARGVLGDRTPEKDTTETVSVSSPIAQPPQPDMISFD
jgi:hypothetical protein